MDGTAKTKRARTTDQPERSETMPKRLDDDPVPPTGQDAAGRPSQRTDRTRTYHITVSFRTTKSMLAKIPSNRTMYVTPGAKARCTTRPSTPKSDPYVTIARANNAETRAARPGRIGPHNAS